MAMIAHAPRVVKALLSNPRIAFVKPSVNWFLYKYLRKFTIADVGGNLIVHSHLPPLNSKAYLRFVNEHLLATSIGPSHAQIGITNACPQRCEYCYNRNRTGTLMDAETIHRTILDLKRLGVFWLGLTGGEPLLNRSIVEIVERAADGCAVKLFTTGCSLTRRLAADLKQAGLFSVSISLDHWTEARHDQVRRFKGAFRAAVDAIEIFKSIDGMHVSVSAVLSKEMLHREMIEQYLGFLRTLGIHEAWLSEAKPSVASFQNNEHVITPEERLRMVELQDEFNKQGNMTVNYLGHFEDAQHFGCTAGHKMVYVDPFGEVSPCVFIPMTFGNVQKQPMKDIYNAMLKRFPTENACFINRNYEVLRNNMAPDSIVGESTSSKLMDNIAFGPLAKFFELHYR